MSCTRSQLYNNIALEYAFAPPLQRVYLFLHQSPQYCRQNPTVLIVGHIDGAIEAGNGLERERCAILACNLHGHFLARLQVLRDARDVVDFSSRQPKRFFVLAWLELERQDAHAHQVAAMDTLEALGAGCTHTHHQRPSAVPVTPAARP